MLPVNAHDLAVAFGGTFVEGLSLEFSGRWCLYLECLPDNLLYTSRHLGSPGEPQTAQLTIFYAGTVNVYDNVPEDKVRELIHDFADDDST